MGIWDTFFERRREFARNGNRDGLRLADMHDEGFACQETEPEKSVAIFTEARRLAEQLGEPWWVFFYDVWRALAMNVYVRDSARGLELAIASVIQARKPEFADHAWRVAAFNELLECYIRIDPAGYAEEILQTIDHLETIIPAGPNDDRMVLLICKQRFLERLGRLDEARAVALELLELDDLGTHDNRWYGLRAVSYLCWLAARQQDWEALAGHAELLEDWAAAIPAAQQFQAEAGLWQAVCARCASDEATAQRRARSVTGRVARAKMTCDVHFHDAVALFHELGDNSPSLLNGHDRELAELEGKGRHCRAAEVHVRRCALLARMGKLRPDDLAAARAAVGKLRRPEKYLADLDALQGL
jgi:hypothetical protein